jgi:histidyl-tRNA synthetase
MIKPAVPKGTRDFSPVQVNRRNYIVEIIKKTFIKYGFQPIETPSMENLSTLTGKYGDEGDQLLFKILKNGDFTEKIKTPDDYKKLAFEICEKGLRYDLTVPFARYVVMNRNEIAFPFKRYQIQPVWRGDRPQKGRYQEFWQCDADVVGSDSLLNEVELVQMLDEVYNELGFGVTILLNNRKILSGIAEVANVGDKMMSMTIAIDKLDKIGIEGVRNEMIANGIAAESCAIIESILQAQTLEELKPLLSKSEIGNKGIEELETVFKYLSKVKIKQTVKIDPTLARGLSYYTGAIFEVKANDVSMGSINGGGRYDDLTGLFGMPNVSGVGISFGLDRIYDVMTELGLFPASTDKVTQYLIGTFDDACFDFGFDLLQKMRAAGKSVELYPVPAKPVKFLNYANARQIPNVIIIGENEMQTGQLMVKEMLVGGQMAMSVEELLG